MAEVSLKSLIFRLSILVVLFSGIWAKQRNLVDLNEENWRQILKGEWMIKFHAPWCPACKDLKKTWDSFAEWSQDLDIKVSSVDVTANPGLSGRFLVTALPTLYHVKNGVFRVYNGPRDKDDFISFIEEKKWTSVDQLPGWKYPDSPQMAVVAIFFRMSMSVRDFHNYLVEQKGLPPVASYLCFGGATLLLGCILGFFIVCIIDCVFPANAAAKDAKKAQKGKDDKKKQQKDAQPKEPEADGTQSEQSADESARQRKGENKGGKVANGKPASPDSKKKK